MDVEVDAQVFAQKARQCARSPFGMSKEQRVPSFARDNGLPFSAALKREGLADVASLAGAAPGLPPGATFAVNPGTGSLYGPVLAHAFCNAMGFPDFADACRPRRSRARITPPLAPRPPASSSGCHTPRLRACARPARITRLRQ
jgi:hypothetical protein